MNKQETAEAIIVMQAWIDGEKIELREPRSSIDSMSKWHDLSGEPGWVLHKFDYRIKPKPREFEIMVMGSGRIRDPAKDASEGYLGEIIKVREVLE